MPTMLYFSSLSCKALSEKVLTSLESCLFTEKLNKIRKAFGKFVLLLLLCNALTRNNINVCGVLVKGL